MVLDQQPVEKRKTQAVLTLAMTFWISFLMLFSITDRLIKKDFSGEVRELP
jgi:hypothetical protein